MAALQGRWRRGTLTRWDDDRGFGFVVPEDGGPGLFVHVSAFPGGRRPTDGSAVTFVPGVDERGRPQARGARLAGGRRSSRRMRPVGAGPAVLVAVGSLGVLAAGAVLDPVLRWVAATSVVLSVATFVTYAVDKSAAGRRGRRVPESTLHLLAALGGWPGALAARRLLRHKTIKQPFRTIFGATVVLHVAATSTVVVLVLAR